MSGDQTKAGCPILEIPLEDLTPKFLLFSFILDVMNSCQVLPKGTMHDGMRDRPFIRVIESVHEVRSRRYVMLALTLSPDFPSQHLVSASSCPLLSLPKALADPP